MSAGGVTSVWRWAVGAVLTVAIAAASLYGQALEREIAVNRTNIETARSRLDAHELTETVGMAGRISALEQQLSEPRYSRIDADRDRAVRIDAERDIREDFARELAELRRRIDRLEDRVALMDKGPEVAPTVLVDRPPPEEP